MCFVVLRQKLQLISEIQNKLLRNSLVKQSLPAPKDMNSMFSTLQDASTADLSQVLGDVKKYASEVVTQDRSIGMSFPWESEKGEDQFESTLKNTFYAGYGTLNYKPWHKEACAQQSSIWGSCLRAVNYLVPTTFVQSCFEHFDAFDFATPNILVT